VAADEAVDHVVLAEAVEPQAFFLPRQALHFRRNTMIQKA
jgi:hypothetical protein